MSLPATGRGRVLFRYFCARLHVSGKGVHYLWRGLLFSYILRQRKHCNADLLNKLQQNNVRKMFGVSDMSMTRPGENKDEEGPSTARQVCEAHTLQHSTKLFRNTQLVLSWTRPWSAASLRCRSHFWGSAPQNFLENAQK